MSETINVVTLDDGQHVVLRIVKMLEDKVFSVETLHTSGLKVAAWEESRLCRVKFTLNKDSQFNIPLCPRRNLFFDLKDKPVFIFESDIRFVMVRTLSFQDTITRTVNIIRDLSSTEVINGKKEP